MPLRARPPTQGPERGTPGDRAPFDPFTTAAFLPAGNEILVNVGVIFAGRLSLDWHSPWPVSVLSWR